MSGHCVICGVRSSTLLTESFRPTLTLELAMTKLCEAMFVPTRHISDMLETLKEDNLYDERCLSALNIALKIQAQIMRLEAALREKADIITTAITEACKCPDEEGKVLETSDEKTSPHLKMVQDTVIENYANAILPICPSGRKQILTATSTSIPVAAILPMRQYSSPVQHKQKAYQLSSCLNRIGGEPGRGEGIDASAILNRNQTLSEICLNETANNTETTDHPKTINQFDKSSDSINLQTPPVKKPVKRKLFDVEKDGNCLKSSNPVSAVTADIPEKSIKVGSRRLSSRVRAESSKSEDLKKTSSNLQNEPLQREVKKCPKCDFKMHFFSPSSELFSYKAYESKKRVELMIVDHYGKHHFAVKPHNKAVDEHGLPSYTCPTCKFQALPPSRSRSTSTEPAEVTRAAYRSLIRHFLSAHEIY